MALVVLVGKQYGSGSSRDWAAKGTALLGVRAVLAESFERIHRSNLLQMGVLPLQFRPGESVEALGLSGQETYTIMGLGGPRLPREVRVRADDVEFWATVRIDTPMEAEHYRGHPSLRGPLFGPVDLESSLAPLGNESGTGLGSTPLLRV